MKKIFSFRIIKVISSIVILALSMPLDARAAGKRSDYSDPEVQERMRQHQKSVAVLEKRVAVESEAYHLEKIGRYQEAAELFKKAIEITGNSAAAGPAHLSLERIYEKTGQYKEALEQTEWFLKGNQNEQGRAETLAVRQRLLQKIEEQKNQHASKKTIGDPAQSNYARQRQFVESMKTQGVATTFREVTLLELDGKFSEAHKVYEKLLLQREAIAQEMTLENWVMLYPAIQRTSELTGDEKREKEALIWIKANMLDPQGRFHQSLSKLLPDVVDHLNQRIKKYQL